eukprot:8922465-Pyramimonas_sp.AAC.1
MYSLHISSSSFRSPPRRCGALALGQAGERVSRRVDDPGRVDERMLILPEARAGHSFGVAECIASQTREARERE